MQDCWWQNLSAFPCLKNSFPLHFWIIFLLGIEFCNDSLVTLMTFLRSLLTCIIFVKSVVSFWFFVRNVFSPLVAFKIFFFTEFKQFDCFLCFLCLGFFFFFNFLAPWDYSFRQIGKIFQPLCVHVLSDPPPPLGTIATHVLGRPKSSLGVPETSHRKIWTNFWPTQY